MTNPMHRYRAAFHLGQIARRAIVTARSTMRAASLFADIGDVARSDLLHHQALDWRSVYHDAVRTGGRDAAFRMGFRDPEGRA